LLDGDGHPAPWLIQERDSHRRRGTDERGAARRRIGGYAGRAPEGRPAPFRFWLSPPDARSAVSPRNRAAPMGSSRIQLAIAGTQRFSQPTSRRRRTKLAKSSSSVRWSVSRRVIRSRKASSESRDRTAGTL